MSITSLKLHSNGSVTLPKAWREQFPTHHFIALVRPEGLLLKPLLDVVEYEGEDGSFGLRFPTGIPAEELLTMVQSGNRALEKKGKSSRKRSKRHG
ncbi:MAG: hypothetical protein Q7R81_05790 [Candidatus Peregrinibacteria bacterium]|nr:hypothetical protein [Candidatus Peregrinibacteria bacterium]